MLQQYELKEKLRQEAEERDRAELKKLSAYQKTLDDRDQKQRLENKRKEE